MSLDWLVQNSSQVRDLILGPSAAAGLLLLYRRTRAIELQAETAKVSEHATRFEKTDEAIEKAVEHMNNDNLGIRLYGIRKLQAIMEKNPHLYIMISHILTGYLYTKFPKQSIGTKTRLTAEQIDILNEKDKNLIIEVLNAAGKRINVSGDWEDFLDFRGIDFSGLGMRNLSFLNCDFSGVNFNSCFFHKTQLDGSYFVGCQFQNSRFAKLSFRETHLDNAEFHGSEMFRVDFRGASLKNTGFSDVKLVECQFDEQR